MGEFCLSVELHLEGSAINVAASSLFLLKLNQTLPVQSLSLLCPLDTALCTLGECYWTPEQETTRQYGKFSVTLLKCRDICPDFLVPHSS